MQRILTVVDCASLLQQVLKHPVGQQSKHQIFERLAVMSFCANRPKVATSGIKVRVYLQAWFFSGKLQNYSEARQSPRLSNVFDQKSVAGLQLEI